MLTANQNIDKRMRRLLLLGIPVTLEVECRDHEALGMSRGESEKNWISERVLKS
jgi:hypothetical protein